MYPRLGIAPYEIGSYTLCAMLGLAVIIWIVCRQLKSISADNQLETQLLLFIPLGALLGLVMAWLSDAWFRGGLSGLLSLSSSGGITFYGWAIGNILFMLLYARLINQRGLFLFNFYLPTWAWAQSLGRIGCFLGGCCFGIPGSGLAFIYPVGSPAYKVYGATPLVPVQLYESFYLFLLGLFLFRWVKFRYRGTFYLLLMASGRFGFEYLRGDDRGHLWGITHFSPAQVISLILVAVAIALLIWLRSSRRDNCFYRNHKIFNFLIEKENYQ